ncbi:hypothetical protein [Actinoplanes italicus]|nr:hypothetical protein [Actinoplanes italicus]
MTAAAKVVAFQQWGISPPEMERHDHIAMARTPFKSISAIPTSR